MGNISRETKQFRYPPEKSSLEPALHGPSLLQLLTLTNHHLLFITIKISSMEAYSMKWAFFIQHNAFEIHPSLCISSLFIIAE